jgi:hypothetical protein
MRMLKALFLCLVDVLSHECFSGVRHVFLSGRERLKASSRVPNQGMKGIFANGVEGFYFAKLSDVSRR